ncbi:MAG: resolvase [Alphaproteobacteria bacterium]|nr:resolvase [Alphaproteobacteria bacterium]
MGKSKRVALYVRVSTDGQSTDNQRQELEQVAERHGWSVVAVFSDRGVSGARGRNKRPGYDALWQAVARREIDLVAAWSVDRLGRSLQDLVNFLSELRAKGVDLYLHQQGLDTSTPAGKAMFQMMGVFAEFERAMIVERVKAGLRRARKEGRVGGRPRVDERKERRAREMLASGVGMRKIAAVVGIGVSVVQRIKAAVHN